MQLELVDIFHFGLSLRLMTGASAEAIADELANELTHKSDQADFKIALEELASSAVSNKAFNAQAFADCMRLMDMDLTELFRQYVGKNTLNFFRQDHGYKDGSYIKIWNGAEDNEVLAEVVTLLDPSDADFQKSVYNALKDKYPA